MAFPKEIIAASWIKATTLGWLLGLILVIGLVSLNETFGLSEFQFFIGIGMGTGIGFMQWRVLKPVLNISLKWVWYSIVGVAAPFLLFDLLRVIAGIQFGEYYIIYSVLLAAVLIGVLQYFLLKTHFAKAQLWIPATFMGWLLAMLAFLGINFTSRFLSGNWPIFAANIFLMLIGGLILGSITGLCLQYFQKGK